ncbi:Hypothetical protein PHPALM_37296 [Phytophthora palmivora]|uniref:Uncharacterized protein n=1 Tax=Phytophthora palmivora TaxID=4796 RepID=A0A2P4WXS5_9STRA|nr:Hypothetical protein PHPALM_37296 [Phytophthora palmivora]
MGRPGKMSKQYARIAVGYTHKHLLLRYLTARGTVNEAITRFYHSCVTADNKKKQNKVSK